MSDTDFYDIIFNIDSFSNLKEEGWKILIGENSEEKYEFFSEPNKKGKTEVNRIGVLGAARVGKTFVLRKLINKYDNSKKNKIETKGISIIYPEINSDNLFVCLDSQGSEEPIIDRKRTYEEIYNLDESEKKKLIKESLRDKKMTEIFIQDFIIDKANILIIVVDQLTFSEQKLIYRLSNKEFDKLFVVHNAQFFDKKNIVEEYIDEVVKKSLYSNLEKNWMLNLDINEENKNNIEKHYYYKEKGIGQNANVNEIIHLFMAKEGSEAGNYFNDATINYMRQKIYSEVNRKKFKYLYES
jgi:GTPase SAR1 family protein